MIVYTQESSIDYYHKLMEWLAVHKIKYSTEVVEMEDLKLGINTPD